ncbi:hypothetical protein DPMN_047031 [Dreissena polymorpha]|uniref:Uncharacterized protein n=1 Tax=Dreissena polymorpha TaxID=45954 RepID=A0A9D4D7Z1_DREPO|nr:hypothetical protein DPMN_047031 [Dreissena polymorpha]
MYCSSLRDGSSLHVDGMARAFSGSISGGGSGPSTAALDEAIRIEHPVIRTSWLVATPIKISWKLSRSQLTSETS